MSSAAGGSAPDDRHEPEPLDVPDPALLEQVLEETLSDATIAQLDPAELRALIEVARRHRGAALVADPIVVELVQSILRIRLRGVDLSDAFWQTVSRQIATTLCEAPDTHERLVLLWNQLSELAP